MISQPAVGSAFAPSAAGEEIVAARHAGAAAFPSFAGRHSRTAGIRVGRVEQGADGGGPPVEPIALRRRGVAQPLAPPGRQCLRRQPRFAGQTPVGGLPLANRPDVKGFPRRTPRPLPGILMATVPSALNSTTSYPADQAAGSRRPTSVGLPSGGRDDAWLLRPACPPGCR